MRQGKITHLIDGLGAGGAERLLVAYAPRLVKLGYDVEVVVLQERGAFKHAYAPGTLREKLFGAGPRLASPHPAAGYRFPA